MTETKTKPKAAKSLTDTDVRELFNRLADRGEEALQRISELPGGTKALTAFNDLKTRVDELGKRVRGVEELEQRVAALEKEIAALKKAKPKPRTAAAKPKTTPSSSSP